jgi:hypothetical protein
MRNTGVLCAEGIDIMIRTARRVSLVMGFALVIVFLCAMPQSAYAESLAVSGIDYSCINNTDNQSVDVLSVDGNKGDSVYVEVKENGTTIASHLHYTLGDNNATPNASGSYTGVLSLAMNDFQRNDTYEITAYADHDQTHNIYDGTIQGIYANFSTGTTSSDKLIALRTIKSNETRTFNPPANVTSNGATYKLNASNPIVSNDPLTYAYEPDNLSDTVSGSITYIDDAGNVLLQDSIDGITANQDQTKTIPKVITSGSGATAKYYRTVDFNGSVTATYNGTKDFTIHCKPLTNGSDGKSTYYFASIKLVDEQGSLLATDSLNVTQKYMYHLPQNLYLKDANGTTHVYELSAKDDQHVTNNTLAFDPSKDGVMGGSKEYSVTYKEVTSDVQTWTVQLINGAADPSSSDRVIETDSLSVKDSYNPPQSKIVNGTTYVRVKGTKDSYSYDSSAYDPATYIYYVPEDYVAPAAYTVDVNYVNIATQETIQTKQYTISPDADSDIAITSPASFTQGDTQYVRLAGQDEPIMHGFYTKYRTYTVYYRDSSDSLNAQTVITHLRVEYADGTTSDNGTIDNGTSQPTNSAAGTSGTDNAGANNANGGNQNTPSAGLSSDEDLNVVNSGDDAPVVNNEGVDSNTERIDDDATPLSAGKSDQNAPMPTALIAGIIGLIVIAGLCAYFIVRRKRASSAAEGSEESVKQDASEAVSKAQSTTQDK